MEKMGGELSNFIKVWTSVFVCVFYCYFIAKIVPKGTARLLCLLPVVCLFLYLPLNFSSIHLGGGTAFLISWLGTFKILLFAFGKGPLASDLSISIGRFMAIACLPIEIQENSPSEPRNSKSQTNQSSSKCHLNRQNRKNLPPKSQNSKVQDIPTPSKPRLNVKNRNQPQKSQHPKTDTYPYCKNTKESHTSNQNHVIKGFLLAVIIGVLYYSQHIHPKLILVLHCLYIYLLLEISLGIVAVLARALGLDLKPHFNEPYLSTSLQNFWGRRWNLVVSSILRSSVYEPTLNFSTCLINRKWAPLLAIFGTFLASGLMHELIYYYMGRVRPTWEVTWFFVLHGLCLTVEIVLKKALKGRCQLPRLISVPLTVGFMVATSFWLFFPQFLRCKADVRMLEEYAAFAVFLKNVSQTFR